MIIFDKTEIKDEINGDRQRNESEKNKKLLAFMLLFSLFFSIIMITQAIKLTKSNHELSIPMGIDYRMLYMSGRIASTENAAEIYNVSKLHEMIQTQLGTKMPADVQWFYPPTLLLSIVEALSYLQFNISFWTWIILTLSFGVYALYCCLPKYKELSLLMLGFPGVFWNIRWGQNSFLSTAILGFGIYFMKKNPVLSGLMFGLVTYKPQIAFFPLLILFITKEWKILSWSIIFAFCTVIISCFLWGFEVWLYFISNFINVAPTVLKTPIWDKTAAIQPTLYTLLRLLDISEILSKFITIAVGIIVTIVTANIWKKTNRSTIKGALLILGTFVFMPYFIQYDLMILCIPFILLIYDFQTYGYCFYEICITAFLWINVLLNLSIVNTTGIQISPIIVLATLIMVYLRINKEKNIN